VSNFKPNTPPRPPAGKKEKENNRGKKNFAASLAAYILDKELDPVAATPRAESIFSLLREERLQRIARYKTRLALLIPPIVEQQLSNDTSAGN
ncbi:unnamed protein product, partial [Ilex paraguariensis]